MGHVLRRLIDHAALAGVEIAPVVLAAASVELQVGKELLARRFHVDFTERCGVRRLLERAVLLQRDTDRFLESDDARVLRTSCSTGQQPRGEQRATRTYSCLSAWIGLSAAAWRAG